MMKLDDFVGENFTLVIKPQGGEYILVRDLPSIDQVKREAKVYKRYLIVGIKYMLVLIGNPDGKLNRDFKTIGFVWVPDCTFNIFHG